MKDSPLETESSIDPLDEERRRRDREAFGDLLNLAEKSQQSKEALERAHMILLGLGVIISLVLIVWIVITIMMGLFPNYSSFIGVLTMVAPLSLAVSVITIGDFIYKRKLRRENKAFEEVISLVHETFEATKDEFSTLEIAETRIRLSRLDN